MVVDPVGRNCPVIHPEPRLDRLSPVLICVLSRVGACPETGIQRVFVGGFEPCTKGCTLGLLFNSHLQHGVREFVDEDVFVSVGIIAVAQEILFCGAGRRTDACRTQTTGSRVPVSAGERLIQVAVLRNIRSHLRFRHDCHPNSHFSYGRSQIGPVDKHFVDYVASPEQGCVGHFRG